MKILLLFDVARPVASSLAYTAGMFLEEAKPAEANILTTLQRLGHEVDNMAVFDNVNDVISRNRVLRARRGLQPVRIVSVTTGHFEPNIPALLDLDAGALHRLWPRRIAAL